MEVKEILSKCDHTLPGPNGHLKEIQAICDDDEVRLCQCSIPRQPCQAGGGVRGGKAAHLHGDRLPQRV